MGKSHKPISNAIVMSDIIEAERLAFIAKNPAKIEQFKAISEDDKERKYVRLLMENEYVIKKLGDTTNEYVKLLAYTKLLIRDIEDNKKREQRAKELKKFGGKTRGEQQRRNKNEKYEIIKDAERRLSASRKPHELNKAIAKDTGLEYDYVRKARKELNK